MYAYIIVYILQEEERKATIAAKVQLEKQRKLEEERKRQVALFKAKQRTAERKKEAFSEYADELLISPGTSPKPPKLPTSPVLFPHAAAERDVTVQLGRTVPSQKSAVSSKSLITEYNLPGQVLGKDESVRAFDHESETEVKTTGTQPLKVDKETNTSMFLLQGFAHFIPATSQEESQQEPTTSAEPELSRMMSTASQTSLSMTDVATFTADLELEKDQGGLDVGEIEDVDEADYLEAVGEVQVAISQELLESAVRMSPRISEAIVERVSSLGPEAMEVLEEIRSKLSVHSKPGSVLQSREESALSIDEGRSSTSYPNASFLCHGQAKSSTFSLCSATHSGKVVPSRPSIAPSLQSINKGMILTVENEDSACALVPPQESIQEERDRLCNGSPAQSSVSFVGSSTIPQHLSLQSTGVMEKTAKAFLDEVFCAVMQNPMYLEMLSEGTPQALPLTETTEKADITEELKSVGRKSISVSSSSIDLHDANSASSSLEFLQTTVSDIPSHRSGASSKASYKQISACSSRPPSALTHSASFASTMKRCPAPSSKTSVTRADKKASASSVCSNQSVKDTQPSQGFVSAANGSSSSRAASRASVESQKVSLKGNKSRASMSQTSSGASKLSVGASHKSMQGVSSQQGSPAPVTKSEVASGTSTKNVQMSASRQQSGGIGNPISSQSSVKSTRKASSKQSIMSTVGGELSEWASGKSVCSMERQDSAQPVPDSRAGSQSSSSGMNRKPSKQVSSVKMVEYHQSPVQSSQTLPLTPEATDQATTPHSQVSMSNTLSVEQVALPQSSKGSAASLSVGESAAGAVGCESVMELDSSGRDGEGANQLVVTVETPEEELQDDDGTPNGARDLNNSSMNSVASSVSLPQEVLAKEASAEAMERAPSRHADPATTSPLPPDAGEIGQPEVHVAEDSITGMPMVEEGVATTFEDGDIRLVQEEEVQVQPPLDSIMDISKQENVDASGGNEAGRGDKQIGGAQDSNSLCKDKEHTTTTMATNTKSSSSLVGKGLTQSSSECTGVGKQSSEQPRTSSVSVGSKASAVSVGKASSKQPSSASVGVGSKASAVSVGKASSKQPSSASVGVGSKASAVSVEKASFKQPSTASVGVGSKVPAVSVGKLSSKQPSAASVGVGSEASGASVGKPSSKQPSTASVSLGSKASAASVGKVSTKQPSIASVVVESNAPVASVGKPSAKQPSSALVEVGMETSAVSVGNPSSKQPSTASVSVESKVSVASMGQPSSKQPSVAAVATANVVESSSGVVQPAEPIVGGETPVTVNDNAAPEEDVQELPTGESEGQSAGGVDEVRTEEPTATSIEGGSLVASCEGVPPGGDKDNAAMVPVNQIVTAPTVDQVSVPCVQASGTSLDKDSVEIVDSEKTLAKQPSCSSMSQGAALANEVAGKDTATSGDINEAAPPATADADDGQGERSPPMSETVSDSALPPAVDESNKVGSLTPSEAPLDADEAQQMPLGNTQVSEEGN